MSEPVRAERNVSPRTRAAQAICITSRKVSTRALCVVGAEDAPSESVFHFSGSVIRVSADASRGSSPAAVDMVVGSKLSKARESAALGQDGQRLRGGHVARAWRDGSGQAEATGLGGCRGRGGRKNKTI